MEEDTMKRETAKKMEEKIMEEERVPVTRYSEIKSKKEKEEEAKAELFPPEDFMKMMFDMQRLLSMLEILNEVLYRIQEGRADEVDMDVVTSGTRQLVESVGNRWGRIMILDGIK